MVLVGHWWTAVFTFLERSTHVFAAKKTTKTSSLHVFLQGKKASSVPDKLELSRLSKLHECVSNIYHV